MQTVQHGVRGFDDPKFWVALFCYGAALPLFFQGNLTWDNFHVVMPFLISFIIVTTLAWDYRIIGSPNHLHCLVLHVAFLVSLIFLLNRLMSLTEFSPISNNPADVQSFLVESLKNMPYLDTAFRVFDFTLKWLGFAAILFIISGAIIFPPRIATPLLFILGLLLVAVCVGRNLDASVWPLFGGLVLMTVAFTLQRVDEIKSRFWNMVAERLSRSGPRPGMDMRIKVALLRELYEQRALGATQIRGLIAGKLDRDTADPQLNPICARITDQVINHDHIAESRDGLQGWRCVLALPEDEPDFFTMCARVVRLTVTITFCVIYILSPIDLIPDATPVFGVVDDMCLGVVTLLGAVRTVYGPSRYTDWTQRKLPFGDKGLSQ